MDDDKSRAEFYQNVMFRQMNANRGSQKGIKRLKAKNSWLEQQHRLDEEDKARLKLQVRALEKGIERAKSKVTGEPVTA